MTRWLTSVLTLMLLMAFTSLGAAQPKAGERKAVDKASPSLMTGRVTQVSEAAKTFTVMTKGKAVTFTATNIKPLPKAGEVVDVTYTGVLGGPLEATTVKGSKSNSDC